jgi:hypothetical protein
MHNIEAQITMSCCLTTLQAGRLRRFQVSHFWYYHSSWSSNALGHAAQNDSIMEIERNALLLSTDYDELLLNNTPGREIAPLPIISFLELSQ